MYEYGMAGPRQLAVQYEIEKNKLRENTNTPLLRYATLNFYFLRQVKSRDR